MAISGGDGSIILTTKVDETGLKKGLGSMKKLGATAGKAFLAIGAAAATATVAITKMASSAYAEFEQLAGGVQKIFNQANIAQIMEDANNAFMELNMSVNDYLRTMNDIGATFSATMGDQKGYDTARQGLLAISDYASGTGKNIDVLSEKFTMITRSAASYQSIADQFSGVLPATSADFLAQAKAAGFLSNQYSKLTEVPIAEYQQAVTQMLSKGVEELGLMGNTAAEAATTISGSANMMKAAWQNMLTAIAGGGDFDSAINNLVYSVQKYFENIVPVVERSLIGIGRLIEQVAPLLIQNVASALIQSIPSLINAIYQMIIGLAKGIWQGIKALFTGGSGSVGGIATEAGSVAADMITSVGGIAAETENASAGMEELGNATEKAGKQAKKTVAAFDELNILSSNAGGTATPASSAGGIGGGSFDTAGISSAESAVGGLANSIEGEFSKIAEMARSIWDSDAMQAFVAAAKSTLSAFGSFASTVWGDIKNNAAMTWQNIESNLRISAQNFVALWTAVWTDYSEAVDKWSPKIIENISGFFNSIWKSAIDPAVQLISKMWADFTGTLVKLWEKHGQPLLNNIGEFANNVTAFFQKIYDSILEPIVTPFLETLSWLWESHISKWVDKIVDFVLKLTNGALEIYNKFISPLVSWLLKVLSPAWSALSSLVIGVFGTIFAAAGDAISSIIGVLGGLIDFITGVFTGNWTKAWQGVKDTFKNIVEGLWGILKVPLNLIIDGINSLISGLNKVKLPDWGILGGLAGKGINIPKIPKLAQGTIIPPNREFLAILGDQKHGTNIEAPAELIKQMAKEAFAEMNMSNQVQREEHYYIGETEVMSLLYKLTKGGERLQGKSLVSGGAF